MPRGIYELAELGYNFVGRRTIARAIREFQPHFVYDRYNSYTTCAVAAGRRAGLPVVLEVNAPVAWERIAYENRRLAFPRLAQWFERTACNLADHVFAVSTPLKEFLVSQRQVPAEKITVLPNGANPETFDPHCDGQAVRRRYGIGERTVIGFVGILRPWHGIEMLLKAFSQLIERDPRVHLLLLGDGPSQAALTAMAHDLKLDDRVTFAGRVGHADVSSHIAAMDIAVSPQATFYASPMKILEYMAIGRPTVAPRMPNILDILEDGKDCCLFEPGNATSLAEALVTMAGDLPRARELGAADSQKSGVPVELAMERGMRSPASASSRSCCPFPKRTCRFE